MTEPTLGQRLVDKVPEFRAHYLRAFGSAIIAVLLIIAGIVTAITVNAIAFPLACFMGSALEWMSFASHIGWMNGYMERHRRVPQEVDDVAR